MKLLLLTDIPPCKDLTAGLVLAQQCRFLPPESVACFNVRNPYLKPQPFEDLNWIQTKTVTKPSEYAVRWPAGRAGIAAAFVIENYRRLVLAPRLVSAAARFAEQQGVDTVWAVLQGQTIVRMAVPLANRLRLPLITQIWDPLSWWMREHRVDPYNRWLAHREFDAAIQRSSACITASWAMAEQYEVRYGAACVPVIASHDTSLVASPLPRLRKADEVVIGMAGQFYSQTEWLQLLAALNHARWQVTGKAVRIKVLGYPPPGASIAGNNLEFLGWKSQSDAVYFLSTETDVLYCPYPFEPAAEEVARLSFPSKLPLYFAAGRPILFHGPTYSSPAHFLRERDAAVLCTSVDATAIFNELERLVRSPSLYARMVANARRTFLNEFTLDKMRANFLRALELARQNPKEVTPDGVRNN